MENKLTNTPASVFGEGSEPTNAATPGSGESAAAKPRFTVKAVRKPLPSELKAAKEAEQAKAGSGQANAVLAHHQAQDAKDQPQASAIPGFRAENEDDDGYDPYSDFHDAPDTRPLFERNPWD